MQSPVEQDKAAAFRRDRIGALAGRSSSEGDGFLSSEELLFELYRDPGTGKISVAEFLSLLAAEGIRRDDPRLADVLARFRDLDPDKDRRQRSEFDALHLFLDKAEFKRCVAPARQLVVRALQNELVIPDWESFTANIKEIFETCTEIEGGKNASYIPQLARVDPGLWGVAICTVDGQQASWGDAQTNFCFQSVSKAFNYALLVESLGSEEVHRWIGQEPSGVSFNELCLNPAHKPHNPLINAGAICTCSLIKTKLDLADRFDYGSENEEEEEDALADPPNSARMREVMKKYMEFAGSSAIGFSNQTFLSERKTADRNFALAYYMRENKAFPEDAKLKETLDLYFQLCSMEATAETAAVMTATLANGGICPMTGERVVSNLACRNTLSLMLSCGMYDYSGQWAFKVGLPGKSGVSGAICVVVPNQMGICVYSPPLDEIGNSVKGIAFVEQLVRRFNFHNYDSVLNAEAEKLDPRMRVCEIKGEQVVCLLAAAEAGDVNALKQYALRGLSLEARNCDRRTALHVAACEGHIHVCRFLKNIARVAPAPRDRWSRTPLEDARFFDHNEVARFLEAWEAESVAKATAALDAHAEASAVKASRDNSRAQSPTRAAALAPLPSAEGNGSRRSSMSDSAQRES